MFKSSSNLFCFLVIFLTFISSNTFAQFKSKKEVDKYFDESGGFKHRLWYGGGFNLGFSGNNVYSQFNFGITPMIGYKVLPALSFGPRIGFDYSYIKGETDNGNTLTGRKSANLTTYSIGVFGRLKFLKFFLLHSELNYQSIEQAFVTPSGNLAYDSNADKVLTSRAERENYLLGGGYNSGDGLFGYEILFLYNFSVPTSSPELPYELRFGFTYKF